ncbi:MAG: hypothetical protein FRX49_04891 [Trebouxia sp. A1-2]|nr:MAG: hypothetical protein FRX49_04891 [Trebouxia sp. A1-2]
MVDCDESSEIDILPCCLGSECVSVANARVCPSGPRTSRVEIADLMEVEQQGQKAYFFVESHLLRILQTGFTDGHHHHLNHKAQLVESDRQLEIKLHCGTLELAHQGIIDCDVNLGTVKSTVTRVHLQ